MSTYPQADEDQARPQTLLSPKPAIEDSLSSSNVYEDSQSLNTGSSSTKNALTPTRTDGNSYITGYMPIFNDDSTAYPPVYDMEELIRNALMPSPPNQVGCPYQHGDNSVNTITTSNPPQPKPALFDHQHCTSSNPSSYPFQDYQPPTQPSEMTTPPPAPSPSPPAPPVSSPHLPPKPNKNILILILDHGTNWASPSHQALIQRLRVHDYDVFASSPASAALSITRYNPAIILVYEANTMNKKCDREHITKRLRDFIQNGGIVIFGGVPLAFASGDGVEKKKKPKAKTRAAKTSSVFESAFNLPWTVAEKVEQKDGGTMIGDTSSDMPPPLSELTLTGDNTTYLHNVDIGARLYRPIPHHDDDEANPNEPCAIALEGIGDGCLGFLGKGDLFDEQAGGLLVGVLRIAKNIVRWAAKRSGNDGKDKKSPAERMMGKEAWDVMHWRERVVEKGFGEERRGDAGSEGGKGEETKDEGKETKGDEDGGNTKENDEGGTTKENDEMELVEKQKQERTMR